MKNKLREKFCAVKEFIRSLFAEHGLLGGIFMIIVFIVFVVISAPVAFPAILISSFNDWTKKIFTKEIKK